jgi:MFS family permease
MIGDLMRDFRCNAATIGTLSAVYFYAYICLQVPVGVMADRWGPRNLITFAAFLCAVGGLLFAMADTLVIAYVGRLLIGAGSAFFFVCALKLVSVWYPPERFAFVSGMIMFIGVAGGIAGQAPVAAAVEVFGWRSVVMVQLVGD